MDDELSCVNIFTSYNSITMTTVYRRATNNKKTALDSWLSFDNKSFASLLFIISHAIVGVFITSTIRNKKKQNEKKKRHTTVNHSDKR